MPEYRVLLGWPNYADVGDLYTPTVDGGFWLPTLPLANIQDRGLARVARSASVALADTRLRVDCKTDRFVHLVAIPKHTLSQAGKARFLGVPSTLLFDYEAGDDIAALGGTFTRTPTTDARAATYVDSGGVLRFAGENRCLRSREFDNATWVKTNITVAANSIANPKTGAVDADTLTASAGNGTCIQDLGVLASAAFRGGLWIKRKTGTGAIQMTLDNGGTWTAVTVTDDWTRLSVGQTVANPDFGIRIVTSGDAIYVWGAQVEPGTALTAYLETTTVTVSAPRDSHFIGGLRHLLIEAARTNLITSSENFGAWTAIGTPVLTAGQADPFGGTAAYLFNDDDGAVAEGILLGLTFTGDGEKAAAWYIREGTSATVDFAIYDNTAATLRHRVRVTWTAGVPVLTTVSGTGTLFAVVALANGWYRVMFSATGIVAANANRSYLWQIGTAASSTGTVYIFGAQAENATFPSSYIPTAGATVTRNGETVQFAYTPLPQAATEYVKFIELAAPTWVAIVGGDPRLSQSGSSGNPGSFRVVKVAIVDSYRFAYNPTGTDRGSDVDLNPSYGDTIELAGQLSAAGAATLVGSKNAAADVTGSTSASEALPATWTAGATIRLGTDGSGTVGHGDVAIAAVRIAAGVQTMAQMRAVVYDSGWIATDQTVYPAGSLGVGDPRLTTGKLTAEEYVTFPMPLIAMPSTPFTGRYWSVQLDDALNAAAYVDLARLMVCGGSQPTQNASYGMRMGWETATQRQELDGGATTFNVKPRRRLGTFTWDDLPEAQALAQLWEMQRVLGIHGQLFLVFDPTDTAHLPRRSFLATLRELSPLTMPNYTRYQVPLAVVEEL